MRGTLATILLCLCCAFRPNRAARKVLWVFRDANPQPWLAFLAKAATDAATLMGQIRPRIERLRDELMAVLAPVLANGEAERLAMALIEVPIGREGALQRRTRLAPPTLTAALGRLAERGLAHRSALDGDPIWVMPEALALIEPLPR